MSDRIPYYNRPAIIAKHCECTWRAVTYAVPDKLTIERDGVLMERIRVNPKCRLHGDNPKYDLPEGI